MRYRKDMIKRIIPKERKGTEILLAENDGFNQNI